MRYFEDFHAGDVFELGSQAVTEADIIAFATAFDPQPFHTDPVRAKDSMYGGLIASGWHTVGIYTRLMIDGLLSDAAGQGSPGVDELRWLKPVRPGDTLSGRFTVLETRASTSRPPIGTVRALHELRNQRDEVVLRSNSIMFFDRRSAE